MNRGGILHKKEINALGWKNFFNMVASVYEREPFTDKTVAEVDFIIEEFKLQSGARILDVGCGAGRHSIELAHRGFNVTGIDFSSGMLAVAHENATVAGVNIEFIESTAQSFITKSKFDLSISLNKGALCLFEDNDNIWGKDMAILANISDALKPDGQFLFTVLNAFKLICDIKSEVIVDETVDLMTLTTRFKTSIPTNKNKENVITESLERYYTPSELIRMVNRIGLKVDNIYGNWKRKPLELNESEFMAIGHKKPLKT